MNGRRTRAWWLIRLEFLVGVALTLLVGRLGLGVAMRMTGGNPPAHPPLIPPNAALALGALAIAITGLVWMLRIIRGPGEDPRPRWRYREVNWHYRDR